MNNLVDDNILSSPFFAGLPRFERVDLQGFIDEKIQRYQASREGMDCTILAITAIRKEEKEVWDSCEELLSRAVKDAAFQARGVYRFDLLSFDMHREINAFNFQDLTTLVVNHSRKLQPGAQQLIKYSSCFGILKKLSSQDWGKIVFKANVEVFAKEDEKFDLLLKKLLRTDRAFTGPLSIVINDQSLVPLYSPDNYEQKERILRLFSAKMPHFELPPELYIRDRNGQNELVSRIWS